MATSAGPSGPSVIAIAWGRTRILAAAIRADWHVHAGRQLPAKSLPPVKALRVLEDLIQELRHRVSDVRAVGVAFPGLVNQRTQELLRWHKGRLLNVPVVAALEQAARLPVFVDKVGNTAVLFEHRYGAARRAQHAVGVALDTAVDGGLILNGELYRGHSGVAGELHGMVSQLEAPGNRWAWGNEVCGRALEREAARQAQQHPRSVLAERHQAGQPLDADWVIDMALAGNPLARRVIASIGERLGLGLGGLVNLLNPEIIVVSGGVSRAGELLLGPARRALHDRAMHIARDDVALAVGRFGAYAALLGAGLEAFDRLSVIPAEPSDHLISQLALLMR